LLNSPFALEQADAFARRLLRESGDNNERLVARGWQLAFARLPTPAENRRALAFLGKGKLADLCLALFNANEFLYID